MKGIVPATAAASALIVIAACQNPRSTQQTDDDFLETPLYEGLGNLTRPVATQSPEAGPAGPKVRWRAGGECSEPTSRLGAPRLKTRAGAVA